MHPLNKRNFQEINELINVPKYNWLLEFVFNIKIF